MDATTGAADLTFGVEIECMVPEALGMRVGSAHHGIQVPELPIGWVACSDSSIDCTYQERAVEIVSPVLKGEDGLRQLVTVLGWLRSKGARVNLSCGFHVHVGFDATKAQELGRVVALVARYEEGLFAITGCRSRANNSFCRSIKNDFKYVNVYKDKPSPDPVDRTVFNTGYCSYPSERYHTLNLCNIGSGRKPTVEFRVFSGTLNTVKAVGYVRVCLGIVEKALKTKRLVDWELRRNKAEQVRQAAMGPGKFAAVKLVYGLGWKRGESDVEFGLIPGEGFPTTKDIVAELYRLADKFDGRVPRAVAAAD